MHSLDTFILARAVFHALYVDPNEELVDTYVEQIALSAQRQGLTFMPSSKPAFVKSSKSASDKDKNDAARCRRHPRFRGDFQVAVSQLIENQYRKLEGHCRDLSEAGMGIILAADVGTGEVLNLTFSLPGSVPPSDVRAVVRFRQGCQYGLEFLSLSEDCRRCIQNYLKSLQPVD